MSAPPTAWEVVMSSTLPPTLTGDCHVKHSDKTGFAVCMSNMQSKFALHSRYELVQIKLKQGIQMNVWIFRPYENSLS